MYGSCSYGAHQVKKVTFSQGEKILSHDRPMDKAGTSFLFPYHVILPSQKYKYQIYFLQLILSKKK
jgi:hypothetical protein